MKRYVVIGLGNFGSTIAEHLYGRGHEVIAVDTDESAVDRVAPYASRSALGNGTDPTVLERLGAADADVGVVSTGDDISASILAVMALKDLNVPEIFVKVISEAHHRVMKKLGVSETVFPERETAIALVARITGKALLNYVKLGEDFGLQEMAVPATWERKTLRQLNLRKEYGVLVVGIHDVLTDSFSPPDPDSVLSESDTLFVAGKTKDLERVAQVK